MKIRVVGGPIAGYVVVDVKPGDKFDTIFTKIEAAVGQEDLWQQFQLHPAIFVVEDGARRVRALPPVVHAEDTPTSLTLHQDMAFVMLRPLGSPPPATAAERGTTGDSASPSRQLSASVPARQNSDAPQTESPSGPVSSYHDRLVAMYTRYLPEKLHTIGDTLREYAGREEAVLQQLVAQYGPEPAMDEAVRASVAPAPPECVPRPSLMSVSEGSPVYTPTGSPREYGSASATRSLTPVEHDGGNSVGSARGEQRNANPAASTYTERLTAIYTKYEPEKVHLVAGTLRKFAGREEAVVRALVKKYGPEPIIGVDVQLPPTNAAAGTPPPPSRERLQEEQQPQAEREEQAGQRAPNAPARENGRTVEQAVPPLSYRSRLIAVYAKYQPEKLSTVEGNLRRFAGREEAMLQKLVERYGPEPIRAEAEELVRVAGAAALPRGSGTSSCGADGLLSLEAAAGEPVAKTGVRLGSPSPPPLPRAHDEEKQAGTVELATVLEPLVVQGGGREGSSPPPVEDGPMGHERFPSGGPTLPETVIVEKEKGEASPPASLPLVSPGVAAANVERAVSLDRPLPSPPPSELVAATRAEDGELSAVGSAKSAVAAPAEAVEEALVQPQMLAAPLTQATGLTRPATPPQQQPLTSPRESPQPLALMSSTLAVSPTRALGSSPAPTPASPPPRAFPAPAAVPSPPPSLLTCRLVSLGRTGAACADFLARQNARLVQGRVFTAWLAYRDTRVALATASGDQPLWSRRSPDGFQLADEVQPPYQVASLVAHVRDQRTCPRDGPRPLSDRMVLSVRAVIDGLRRCLRSQAIEISSAEEHGMVDDFLAQWSTEADMCPVRDDGKLAHALQQAARFLAQIEDLMDVVRAQDEELAKLKDMHTRRVAREAGTPPTEAGVGELMSALDEAKQRERVLETALEAALAAARTASAHANSSSSTTTNTRASGRATPVSPRRGPAAQVSARGGTPATTPRDSASVRTPSRHAVRSPPPVAAPSSSWNGPPSSMATESRREEHVVRLQQELARTRTMLTRSKAYAEKLQQRLAESEERQVRLQRVIAATSVAHQEPRAHSASAGMRGRFSRPSLSLRGGGGDGGNGGNGSNGNGNGNGGAHVLDHDERLSSPRGGEASPWPKSRFVPTVPQRDRGLCPNCTTPLTSLSPNVTGTAGERAAFCFSCRRSFTFGDLAHRDGVGSSHGVWALWNSR